jgi:hypothetical protein
LRIFSVQPSRWREERSVVWRSSRAVVEARCVRRSVSRVSGVRVFGEEGEEVFDGGGEVVDGIFV